VIQLLGLVGGIAKNYMASRGRISEAKEAATIKAIETRSVNAGWMDDYLLILHSIPMIMVFIPAFRGTGIEGIDALALLPSWYLQVWFSMVGAVWGLPKLSGLASSMVRKR
tara:strand:- start:271 stop:603 length:333 start_codon:yes stop_codon:yes gene_type:complete